MKAPDVEQLIERLRKACWLMGMCEDAERIIREWASERWVPVSERLPTVDQFVLVYWERWIDVVPDVGYWGGDLWREDDGTPYSPPPSHWMPLPAPPQAAGRTK